jgi:hypothetical protein
MQMALGLGAGNSKGVAYRLEVIEAYENVLYE